LQTCPTLRVASTPEFLNHAAARVVMKSQAF
jgi:hypothetical protein